MGHQIYHQEPHTGDIDVSDSIRNSTTYRYTPIAHEESIVMGHQIYYQGSHTSDIDVSDSVCIIRTRLAHPALLLVPV